MSFEMLPVEYIRRWLAGPRPVGDKLLSRYTGIPVNTFIWLANKPTANISVERQRLLSKVIAQIENGQLVFEAAAHDARVRVPRIVDKPRALVRYGFDFKPGGPRLRAIDRPKAFAPMITFRDALLTKR